jgi:AraC-like DNA-binding protein
MARTGIDRRLTPDQVSDSLAPLLPRTSSSLADTWDFKTALRSLVRPYLAQGHPHLSLMAEIVGMSELSLQRRLAQSGTSYSDVVQEARFSLASDLLADPLLNIADIAFAAGYENASHFSRAFKRFTV